MSSGMFCNAPDCLIAVDNGGYGQSQCDDCGLYYCQDHLFYPANGPKVCGQCLERRTRQRTGARSE